jgi:hypothetical protein
MKGLEICKYPLILLLDADLLDLQESNITELINGVTNNIKMSISFRKNTPFAWKIIGIDFISGERVFPKSILGDIHKLKDISGFGLEVFINKIIVKNKYLIKVIKWDNVSSPGKSEKMNSKIKGVIADLNMLKHIFYTIGFFEALLQIYYLHKLKK